jgi:hypothetical protein
MAQMNPVVRDPLFQLNLVLWLAQPLPKIEGQPLSVLSPNPILHQHGFRVYAVAPKLPLPERLVLKARQSGIPIQPSGRPDVVLQKQNRAFSLVECKASSFKPADSASKQARTFLLMTHKDSAEVFGMLPQQVSDTALAYLLPEPHRKELQQTLSELEVELRQKGFRTGSFTILGLNLQQQSSELRLIVDKEGHKFFGIPQGTHPVLPIQPDTDPRPLYFIPYDPDVDQSQEERQFCRRILCERILGAILGRVGRTKTGSTITVSIDELLSDATLGMFRLWRNRDSAKHLRDICRKIVRSIGAATYDTRFALDGQSRTLSINLTDTEWHEQLLRVLERFSCESMSASPEQQPELFEEE